MLELKKLYLDGWLSYDKETIPLDVPGITQIKGETGSGKSGILEAIFYLFTGTTIRKLGRKASLKDLINKTLNSGYSIALEFTKDGHWYKIQEIRGRGDSDNLYFWKDEESSEGSLQGKRNQETRKNILAALEMPPEELLSRAFIGQRVSQELLTGTSGSRGKLITQMFGLQKYDDLISSVNIDINTSVSEKTKLVERVEEYKADLKGLEEALDFSPIEEVDPGSLDNLEERIQKVETKLENIQKKKEGLIEIIGTYDTIKRQREKLEEWNKEIEKIKEKLEGLPKVDQDYEVIKSDLQEAEEKKADLKVKVSHHESELKKIEKLGDLCPINKDACPINVPKLFKDKREEKHKEKITVFSEEYSVNSLKCVKLTGRKNSLEKKQDLEKNLRTKEEAKNKISTDDLPDIKNEKENIEKCKLGLEKGKNKLKELQDQREEIRTTIKLAEQREENNKKIQATLKEKREFLESMEEKISVVGTEVQYLSAVISIFKKAKMYKIDLILEYLNKNIQEQLDKFDTGYKALFKSQKKDSKGKSLLDFLGIDVYNGSVWLPIELISGGQEMQVGLAALLSVYKTAHDLSQKSMDFLFLDEPFGHFDTGLVETIFEAISDVSKELGVASIKLISHREDLSSSLVDHMWMVNMEDGISHLETEEP